MSTRTHRIPLLATSLIWFAVLGSWSGGMRAALQSGGGAEPATPTPSPTPAASTTAVSATIWDGAYSAGQATRGQARYQASCSMCHAEDLLGMPGPPLLGEVFMNRWTGATADDMFQTIRRSMPQAAPDSLGLPAYADIVSYLLQSNGAPAGASELPTDPAALRQILVTPRAASR